MPNLGTCEIQYVRCLWHPRRRVLSADRRAGANPLVDLISDDVNEVFVLRIYNNVEVEAMYSSPREGAKSRMDIHLTSGHILPILNVLEPFVNSLTVTFDEAPRQAPNPTGMEHPNGLPLGRTEPVTWIKASSKAFFGADGYSVISKADERLIIDAENYNGRKRLHLGTNMESEMELPGGNVNRAEIMIKYSQLQRFVHAIRVAYRWLTP